MKNCVFNDKGKCKALSIGTCKGKCNFAQDKEQYDEGRKKSRKRLSSLPAEMQRYIADKYYSGREVWKRKYMGD